MTEGKDENAQPLLRREAVRHNTPGLFGEVILAAPPATWVLTGSAVLTVGIVGALLLGLDVDGLPLWRWLASAR